MNRAKQWNEQNSPALEQPKKKIVVKVKRRPWITKGEKIIYATFSIGLIIACLYIVFYASKLDSLNREVQQLDKQVYDQKMENEALYFEVSELSSPDRIIKIARENGLKIQDAKVKRATAVNQ